MLQTHMIVQVHVCDNVRMPAIQDGEKVCYICKVFPCRVLLCLLVSLLTSCLSAQTTRGLYTRHSQSAIVVADANFGKELKFKEMSSYTCSIVFMHSDSAEYM